MLRNIPFPALPVPPSWYPGHMTQFTRMLPTLLRRTDVVLELRDSRLPLTSINRNFEAILQKWRLERGGPRAVGRSDSTSPEASYTAQSFGAVCERIVVFNKRDLVAGWGFEPFRKAMAIKYPDQKIFFASWNSHRDIRTLNNMIVDIAKQHPMQPELNVLVVGMPNVGKSTLLNALRAMGIPGPTPKALRTSAHPGLTRALSTRLKLSLAPLVYSYDSPGVMLPFLGKGDKGAERGVKLALIAGIKEGMYDVEALASYLLYRLNILDPIAPAYLSLLPPATSPIVDIYEFLDLLARRLGMLKRGGIVDQTRAAVWFIKWWRDNGGQLAASTPLTTSMPADGPQTHRRGWGFDFEWSVDQSEVASYDEAMIQRKMETCIDAFEAEVQEEEQEGGGISSTQEKKRFKEKLQSKRVAKSAAKLAARKNHM